MNFETISKEENNPIVSVIIVNYNGKDYLEECIYSIEENIGASVEIILVDNASADGSQEYIRESFSDITYIESDVNLGFAGGNNLGARKARGEYILLLNNDAALLTGIESALSILDNEKDVGVIGAKMLGKNKEYRLSAGYFPVPSRLLIFSRLYKREGPFKNGMFDSGSQRYFDVDWVEGSFLLTRKNIWNSIGGLDDGYFMYGEDIDFCRSIKDLNYRVLYLPEVVYKHVGGYATGRMTMLINGFLRYHSKYSTTFTQKITKLVLKMGLYARLILYSIFSMFNRHDNRKKSKASIKAALKDCNW